MVLSTPGRSLLFPREISRVHRSLTRAGFSSKLDSQKIIYSKGEAEVELRVQGVHGRGGAISVEALPCAGITSVEQLPSAIQWTKLMPSGDWELNPRASPMIKLGVSAILHPDHLKKMISTHLKGDERTSALDGVKQIYSGKDSEVLTSTVYELVAKALHAHLTSR